MSKSPTQVFTPRNPDVNEAMYIDRPNLERAFRRALAGTQHVLLHGESGTGKSWLYKRILHADGAAMLVANLANASRLGSIAKEIEIVSTELLKPAKTSYTETKSAEASAFGFAKGGLSHTDAYQVPQGDPLERCFEGMRLLAGSKPCYLVLDNLETIFGNPGLMRELGDIVVLLDDKRYARHSIKLLIVGVPRGVREYFSRTENRTTVTNRIAEVPEVASLDSGQVDRLVRTGFVTELKYECTEATMVSIVKFVTHITSGIPQMVHELCLELAYVAEEEAHRLDESQLQAAAFAWLQSSLTSSYAAVEAVMNERNTVAGRRNQVLFALGQIEKDEFGYTDVEDIVRRDFPESTADKTLNIGGMLSELADRKDSLIKRSPKANSYSFVDPKYRMCLRVMLKNVEERVEKVEIRNLPLLKG